MRIELPSTSWADTVHRADDDAHTLTVAAQPAIEWLKGSWLMESAPALRTHVGTSEAITLTLTL